MSDETRWTFIEAARAVLVAAGRQMTAREIVDLALERGLIRTEGKTPDATMSAVLYAGLRARTPGLRRVAIQGRQRAVRGSVHWEWSE